MNDRISDERLDEILAGLEGVTPGPWIWGAKYVSRKHEQGTGYDTIAQCGKDDFDTEKWCSDAAHIARCDPDTIRALIEEVQASRRQSPDGVTVPYDQISTIVHDCRERQKQTGESDQMLSRWISERLSTLTPSPGQKEAVAWPIETEDQVEALARECGWNNRRYMSPADYSIWCERLRKFAALANPITAQSDVPAPVTFNEEDVERACKALFGDERWPVGFGATAAIDAKIGMRRALQAAIAKAEGRRL